MKAEVQRALEQLYDRDGSLSPHAVVEEADDPKSPLHPLFDWNDEKAAMAHRLNQARQLIRVAVTVLPSVANQPVRQFVSLSDLRRTGTGSYLATAEIVSDPERRELALRDALTALMSMQKRFRYLSELSPVWDTLASLVAQAGLTDESEAA